MGTRLRALMALVASVSILAGCATTQATPEPTGVAPTTQPSTPASSPTAAAVASPSVVPTASSNGTGRWESAGTMPVVRAGRSVTHAVLLGDGRVLLVGGSADFGSTADDSVKTELWDPTSGAWHTTESLNKPRDEFVAVPLADGRALVTGGTNPSEQSYSSTYIYDPAPGHETWTKAGLLGTARTDAAAAVLPDGRVLVVGGFFHLKPSFGFGGGAEAVLAAYRPASAAGAGSSGPRVADIEPPHIGAALATAELYDPAADAWSATGPLTYARVGAQAVTLDDGRVLVVGSRSDDMGVTVDDHASTTAEIYDPATGRFSPTEPLPKIDRAALEKAGVAHANPVPDQEPNVLQVGTLVALADGGAVLMGHAGYWKHAGEITRSFRYDAAADRWTEIGTTYIFVGEPTAIPLETVGVRPLTGAMVERLPDGRILVVGGASAIPEFSASGVGTTTAAADIYDPASDTWTPGPPMPEPRAGAATTVLADGSVLLAGGYSDDADGESSVLTTAIRYVP